MKLASLLQQYQEGFCPVVPFDPTGDRLLALDLTAKNTALHPGLLADTTAFSAYIDSLLLQAGARYGIGGYNEHRTVYARSTHFDDGEEPRRLHLGTDIWGPAGTRVAVPLAGQVHSFAYNDHFGDYGATIILQHELDGFVFHTLYGHLSLRSLEGLREGQPLLAGQFFAELGEPFENGAWPPHLHIQVIADMQGHRGDYPGVCRFSERDTWLANCPDPDHLLCLNQFVE
jgi:peptidoglycan LD-endopeptidase LytH